MSELQNDTSSKQTKYYIKSLLYYLPISAILIFVDQLTKYLVSSNMEEHTSIVVWDGVFEIYFLRNPFASFNFGQSFPQVFYGIVITFSIIFIAVLIYFMLRVPPTKEFRLLQVILILFFAGTIGNFIDRVLYHSVIDFFYFKAINFPVFNVADIFVVVGAALFIFAFFFKNKMFEKLFPDKKKKEEAEAAAQEEKTDMENSAVDNKADLSDSADDKADSTDSTDDKADKEEN